MWINKPFLELLLGTARRFHPLAGVSGQTLLHVGCRAYVSNRHDTSCFHCVYTSSPHWPGRLLFHFDHSLEPLYKEINSICEKKHPLIPWFVSFLMDHFFLTTYLGFLVSPQWDLQPNPDPCALSQPAADTQQWLLQQGDFVAAGTQSGRHFRPAGTTAGLQWTWSAAYQTWNPKEIKEKCEHTIYDSLLFICKVQYGYIINLLRKQLLFSYVWQMKSCVPPNS